MRIIPLLLAASVLPAAELISGGAGGGFSAGTSLLRGISDDASVVIFESDGAHDSGLIFPPEKGIYLRDRLTYRTRLLAPYEDRGVGSAQGSLSGDGRAVAYVAWNLPPEPDVDQVRVRTIASGVDVIVSTNVFGIPGSAASREPALSGDARYVAFVSDADDLTADGLPGVLVGDVFVKDRITNATTCVSLSKTGQADTGACARPAISRNGRVVAFHSESTSLIPAPVGAVGGVYARDLVAGTTVRVDVSTAGVPAASPAYDLYPPAISADGRFVAFASSATNLVPDDTDARIDVFVRDLRDRVTTRISVAAAGAAADDHSLEPSLSLDGRYVAFRSYATNLIATDTNRACDVFVRDRVDATTIRVDFGLDGVQADADAWPGTRICGLGFAVAYTSMASNLVGGSDRNGRPDVYLNANDPRFAASSAFRLYVRTLIAWVQARLPVLRVPRANG
ncbi:MAG TPA: hypothetical protein VEL07_20890 [Planctomycetota bacterium]|nr:hypothetical protein [Planctomycetota bacterium]